MQRCTYVLGGGMFVQLCGWVCKHLPRMWALIFLFLNILVIFQQNLFGLSSRNGAIWLAQRLFDMCSELFLFLNFGSLKRYRKQTKPDTISRFILGLVLQPLHT